MGTVCISLLLCFSATYKKMKKILKLVKLIKNSCGLHKWFINDVTALEEGVNNTIVVVFKGVTMWEGVKHCVTPFVDMVI